jgi:hypothetical protein
VPNIILTYLSIEDDALDEPIQIPRMDAKFAEDIVRKWQSFKSKALGSDHSVASLQEVRFKTLTGLLVYSSTHELPYVARDTWQSFMSNYSLFMSILG